MKIVGICRNTPIALDEQELTTCGLSVAFNITNYPKGMRTMVAKRGFSPPETSN